MDFISVVLILISSWSIQGKDGRFLDCLLIFACVTVLYVVLCLGTYRRLRDVPFIRHPMLFVGASILPMFIVPIESEEMGGMMILIVPICAAIIVPAALVVMGIRNGVRALFRR
jgi:hypothetical protein